MSPPKPDEDWEAWAERELEDSAHDTELGKQLAKDAIRMSRGDLTEEEFHEKHHEDVLEEFGEDARPTKPDWFDDE